MEIHGTIGREGLLFLYQLSCLQSRPWSFSYREKYCMKYTNLLQFNKTQLKCAPS
jgi:hypothetical protein